MATNKKESIISIDQGKLNQILTDKARSDRARAYVQESDPIALKVLRGEATPEELQEKVEEIRRRFPYPSAIND